MSMFVSEGGFPYDTHALQLLSGSFIRVDLHQQLLAVGLPLGEHLVAVENRSAIG